MVTFSALSTIFFSLIIVAAMFRICRSDRCLIKLPKGYVKGTEGTTVLNNKGYVAFKGIPYAEPPVGHLRFKDPLPVKPWSNIINGSDVSSCPQINEHTGNYTGNENCLFINVFTPQLLDEEYSNLLPVIVWIHGGAFRYGSGLEDYLGPDFLIEYDIVLVTFNYRLNVFGFLNLGNKEVPGNAGLKDQNLALKWVQSNIKYFGGDKDKVTLAGNSAGSMLVHLHTLIPQSSGLFQRVVMESGTALSPWAISKDPVNCAIALGKVLGFETSSVYDLYNFLKDQSPEILAANENNAICNREREMPFVPSKEVAGTGLNFLIEDPEVLMASQQFARVPYIIGMNNKEGLLVLEGDMETSPDTLKVISNDPKLFLPEDLNDTKHDHHSISLKIKEFYYDNLTITWENVTKFVDLETDRRFLINIDKVLYYLTKSSDVPPVYVYMFSFQGNLSHLRNKLNKKIKHLPPGAAHADDVGYLFYNKEIKMFIDNKDSPDMKTVNSFCTLWTNFAKFSDPNEESFEVVWDTYTDKNQEYLEISETLKEVHSYLFENRTKFWYNLYNLQP